MIKVSEDLSGLQYSSKKSGILAYESWKDIKFSDLRGMLYGGVSMTFQSQKTAVIEDLNRQRWEENHIEWPLFGGREPLKVPKNLKHYQRCKRDKDLTIWRQIAQKWKSWTGGKKKGVDPFYSWECLTLIRGMFHTTFDIVIKDMVSLLCLIHVVHRHMYNDFSTYSKTMADTSYHRANTETPIEFMKMKEQRVSPAFMLVYKRMKISMKLSYESYMKNVRVGRLFNLAIYKTIIQRQCMAANTLSSFLTAEYAM